MGYKIILSIIILLFTTSLYSSNTLRFYKLKYKNGKSEVAKVVVNSDSKYIHSKFYKLNYKNGKSEVIKLINMNSRYLYVMKHGKIKKILTSSIKSQILISKQDYKFKRVIIFTRLDYIRGYIIYQDRNKLSLSLDLSGNRLLTFKTYEILDIVDATEFDYEMNKSASTAFLWSALYPGLGQLYTYDRNISAVFFAGSFTVSLGSGIFFLYRSEKEYEMYKNSKYKDEYRYYNYETYRNIGFGLVGIASVIYVWNLVDSYFNFKYKWNVTHKRTTKKLSFNLYPTINMNYGRNKQTDYGLYLSMKYTF